MKSDTLRKQKNSVISPVISSGAFSESSGQMENCGEYLQKVGYTADAFSLDRDSPRRQDDISGRTVRKASTGAESGAFHVLCICKGIPDYVFLLMSVLPVVRVSIVRLHSALTRQRTPCTHKPNPVLPDESGGRPEIFRLCENGTKACHNAFHR